MNSDLKLRKTNMIKKILPIGLLCSMFALTINAGIVNGIALSINEYPITMVDIDNKMEELKISKNEAVSILIDEALYNQSLDKYKISVDSFDVDAQIEKLAKNNKMTMIEFKNAVKQQEDYDKFSEKIKLQLRHQKLVSAIASNKLIMANDEDLKIYYNNNIEQFKIAEKIDVIHYTSKDKALLEALKANPMLSNPNVLVANETLKIDKISDQMKYIVTKTPEKSFSTIFVENQTFNLLFVSSKADIKITPLEIVKETIFNEIMTNRENEYLKNYFENLKLGANVKILK